MIDSRVQLVLKPENAEGQVVKVAMEQDWELRVMGNRKADVFINVFLTDDEAEVRYTEDPLTGIPFVTIRGAGCAEIAELFRPACVLREFPEALALLQRETDRDQQLLAIGAAANTAPEQPVAELVEAFRALAANPDPGIRQAVVIATGCRPWPELVEIVRGLSERDEVEHVRANARLLLEGLAGQR
ncbi:hypothetical protein SAMN02982929_02834 [Saccharopolyspora kobensis]|uniref:HEAT repeat domain-containing protein n=1 Tax=Saccharopolyspora kobensis TaxID=146035 RepID=A0A1H6BT95_9PSEU|nr:HEAT repeat domain-containing protein [Saccharopolyspora kobensis]SEG63951.1 hypothetical protein SAMN02982929_02834 [Saccharopolyspora kobensis]SFC15319.1 hypothetical protein SAMN05216506_10173 [Saccharopolyspora kobensis]